MIESPHPQGSAEWLSDRLGTPSASMFSRILTPATLQLSKQADGYINRLLGERFSGMPHEQQDGGVETVWMARGVTMEAEALAAYSLMHDCKPRKPGFCWLDERKRVGCSPDALVETETVGCIEIKSPMLSTHIGYQLGGALPDDYKLQVLGEIYVTGAAWCDFISYYPGQPLFVHRTWRDDATMETLRKALDEFCDELDRREVRLIEMGYRRAA